MLSPCESLPLPANSWELSSFKGDSITRDEEPGRTPSPSGRGREVLDSSIFPLEGGRGGGVMRLKDVTQPEQFLFGGEKSTLNKRSPLSL